MTHRTSRKWLAGSAASLMAVMVIGCGGADETSGPSSGDAASASSRQAAGAPDWTPTIQTATVLDDPCKWIPAEEAEAVLGRFAEPPRREDGCLYTLVIPDDVLAKRQRGKEMQEKIAKAFGKPDEAFTRPGSIFAAQDDPKSYAVSVSVNVEGGVEGEQAVSAMAKQFGGILANQAEKSGEAKTGATDWDDARGIPYGFIGRVGHVRISVQAKAPDVARAKMEALAARVRDRIPDQPFPVTNPYQIIQLGSVGDPCSLLTREEAEAVLGPLTVAPYRSSSNWPPLAHGQGHACAYYTAGHHVFALVPEWSGGADSFKIDKGIGGLIGAVLPQEQAVIMKGPWDASQSGIAGELMFLKGDQLLAVHYQTSRATRGEAVKLAAIAMPRMAR